MIHSSLHLFFAGVGLLLLLRTLPLAIELVVLSLAATLPARRVASDATAELQLAVVVPAHNEQRLIGACVESLMAAEDPRVRVFVVAHNCIDATGEMAAAAGAEVLALEGPGGKGLALDHGFQHALRGGADAVLVIDADSIVSDNLLGEVIGAMGGGSGAVQVRYQVRNTEANVRTRLSSLALLGMNVLRPKGRSRLGLSCGIFGNGFALSAETLRRVPYTANSLVEDLEYHLRLIAAGVRVDFLDETAVYGEMPEQSAAAQTQRARWEGGRTLMRREWSLPLLTSVIKGRLRFAEPLFDLLALPLATQAGLLVLGLVLPLTWMRLYSLAGLLAAVLYVLVAALLSDQPAATLKALVAAPGYVLWKVLMIPQKRRAARKDAAWVRTERNDDVEAQLPAGTER